MRILFPGGFHLTQRIRVPGGIDMTQQGERGALQNHALRSELASPLKINRVPQVTSPNSPQAEAVPELQ